MLGTTAARWGRGWGTVYHDRTQEPEVGANRKGLVQSDPVTIAIEDTCASPKVSLVMARLSHCKKLPPPLIYVGIYAGGWLILVRSVSLPMTNIRFLFSQIATPECLGMEHVQRLDPEDVGERAKL